MTDGIVQIQPMACFLNVPFNHDNLLLTMASHPVKEDHLDVLLKWLEEELWILACQVLHNNSLAPGMVKYWFWVDWPVDCKEGSNNSFHG